MPRKSYADIVSEEVERRFNCDCNGDYGRFLVVYDFSCIESKIPNTFYKNLEKLSLRYYFNVVQKSVIEAYSEKAAHAVALLAKMYGANVRIYEVKREVKPLF